jgi:hypothetical protein
MMTKELAANQSDVRHLPGAVLRSQSRSRLGCRSLAAVLVASRSSEKKEFFFAYPGMLLINMVVRLFRGR